MNHANAKGESLRTFSDSAHRQAGAEANTIVAKRLVFHLGGYDPITPYVVAQRRFVRELARFEQTWSTKASMGALEENADQAKWSVITKGPNWQVESDYRLVRWDDVIAVATRHEVLVKHGAKLGPEVDDHALLDIPIETLDVVVTSRTLTGRPLAEIGRLDIARGVFLKKLVRAGEEMPIIPEMRLDRGDVLTLIGTKTDV